MFSITLTKSQAEQFIHGIFQKNFRDNPEFIVRINDEEGDMEIKKYIKELSSGSEPKVVTADKPAEPEVNPWLVPDENGWFTHDPDWKSEVPPLYINQDQLIHTKYRCGDYEENVFASEWDWRQTNNLYNIIKWKYV